MAEVKVEDFDEIKTAIEEEGYKDPVLMWIAIKTFLNCGIEKLKSLLP